MCKFCEKVKNEECAIIASKKNDLGILGNMEVGFMVSDNYDGTFTINTSTTGIFDRIDEAEFIINFCPICGRDLRSEENDKN